MKSLVKHSEPNIIDVFKEEMDRFFDDVVPFSRKINGDRSLDVWSPMTDMSETETEYKVILDLPGIEKKDITVNIKDHRLVISGERKKEEKEEKRDFMRKERYFGSFYRSFTLPEPIKKDAIKAQFKDGVLEVTVPKNEEKKSKSINID
jgi:HSP20 family protein